MTRATTRHPPPPRRTRLALALLAGAAIATLAGMPLIAPIPRVVYNPSGSVPIGWYRITPFDGRRDALAVDSIVLTRLPPPTAQFAARRGYLPVHIPLLKRVGARAPQIVCTDGDIVRIDGAAVARVRHADYRGQPLHAWPQCRALAGDELFLLSTTHPASFDSRYFGPIRASAVLGIAHPLRVERRR